MKTAMMSNGGRLTVPAEARAALGIDEEAEFEIEVDADGDALILRPVVALRREDAWAYTTEHRALLQRAHEDSREGHVRRLTEQGLRDLES